MKLLNTVILSSSLIAYSYAENVCKQLSAKTRYKCVGQDMGRNFTGVSCKAKRRLQFTDGGNICNGSNNTRCLFHYTGKNNKRNRVKMVKVNSHGDNRGDYFTFEHSDGSFKVLTPDTFKGKYISLNTDDVIEFSDEADKTGSLVCKHKIKPEKEEEKCADFNYKENPGHCVGGSDRHPTKKHPNAVLRACPGCSNKDYTFPVVKDLDQDECKKLCDVEDWCTGFEYIKNKNRPDEKDSEIVNRDCLLQEGSRASGNCGEWQFTYFKKLDSNC